jgi:hypothetical protein
MLLEVEMGVCEFVMVAGVLLDGDAVVVGVVVVVVVVVVDGVGAKGDEVLGFEKMY